MEGSEYIVHPKYDDHNLYNDIAVLVLPSPLVFSASVSAICVPTKPLSIEGSTGVVSGWGYPKEDIKRTTTHMMYVTQKVQPESFCEAALRGQPYHPSTMFCAYKHTYDACQGDSGGGFWVPVGSRWVLVGIVSYGIGCGVPHQPGIYTDLASYLPWIRNMVKL
ncbi:vitamin K-dependent protein C [Ixodes scapularis]|uniref:vitamin K-dependent protein C n=1 Tax=Ixodes scapularis TaxID=6945 RepID=UPI001C38AA8A|nr:vitamin K-dependent protein C [Ixodes scapularis]